MALGWLLGRVHVCTEVWDTIWQTLREGSSHNQADFKAGFRHVQVWPAMWLCSSLSGEAGPSLVQLSCQMRAQQASQLFGGFTTVQACLFHWWVGCHLGSDTVISVILSGRIQPTTLIVMQAPMWTWWNDVRASEMERVSCYWPPGQDILHQWVWFQDDLCCDNLDYRDGECSTWDPTLREFRFTNSQLLSKLDLGPMSTGRFSCSKICWHLWWQWGLLGISSLLFPCKKSSLTLS